MHKPLSRLVCFDLEMCCWDQGPRRTGEIIEFSLAEVDLASGHLLRSNQYYVAPEHDQVSEFCTGLTGITPRIVRRQGRPLADVLATVQRHYGGRNKLYASWGRDDLILRRECAAKGLEYPLREHLNLNTLYRLRYQTPNLALSDAMARIGLCFEGQAHSALVDARNLAQLALQLLPVTPLQP